MERRDLHRLLFAEMHRRIQNKPALIFVVKDWERRFLHDYRIGSDGHDPSLIFRVRKLAREIIVEFEPELAPVAA